MVFRFAKADVNGHNYYLNVKICGQTTSKIAHVQGLWFNNLFIYLFIPTHIYFTS
jgi:hypothetical protein